MRAIALVPLLIALTPRGPHTWADRRYSENVRRSRDQPATSLRDARTSEASTLLHELADLGMKLAQNEKRILGVYGKT